MADPRFFIDEPLFCGDGVPAHVPLSTDDLHHALRVSRIRVGEHIVVVDPRGGAWRVEVTRIDGQGVEGVATALDHPSKPSVQLVVFQGIPKAEKMDLIVRQCVELGVSRIVPVVLSRTVVRLDEKKRRDRVERWRRIALSAAKQAGREGVPDVCDICDLEEAIELVAQIEHVFLLWEECDTTLLGSAVDSALSRGAHSVGLFIGPEGGIERLEASRLEGAGCTPVSMGPFILRTETAAVAAAGIAMSAALASSVDG